MKETRVYIIDIDKVDLQDNIHDLSNDDFMDIAEEQGTVYTLKGFQNVFNESTDEINATSQYLRFITIDIDK